MFGVRLTEEQLTKRRQLTRDPAIKPRTRDRLYRACDFAEEGHQRAQQWLDCRYVDLVYMGLLGEEWQPAERAAAKKET